MSAPARRVVLADIRGRVVALRPITNGSGLTHDDIRALATAAALLPRCTPSASFIALRELEDFEALARLRGVVVTRRGGRPAGHGSVAPAPATPLPVEAAAGPRLHACAGRVCRVPGCQEARLA